MLFTPTDCIRFRRGFGQIKYQITKRKKTFLKLGLLCIKISFDPIKFLKLIENNAVLLTKNESINNTDKLL